MVPAGEQVTDTVARSGRWAAWLAMFLSGINSKPMPSSKRRWTARSARVVWGRRGVPDPPMSAQSDDLAVLVNVDPGGRRGAT